MFLAVGLPGNRTTGAHDNGTTHAAKFEERELDAFPDGITTSEMVLCPILWGINYHIFVPVRLDEILNSIVDTRLKFVYVYQKKIGTVYTYFF